MRDADRAYYALRASQERALCDTVRDPSIRAIHLDLALRYEAALREDATTDATSHGEYEDVVLT